MTWDEERAARAVLTQVVDAGDPRVGPLVAAEGAASVLAALRASPREDAWPRRARAVDAEDLERRARAHALRFLVPGDDEWPLRLDDLDRCDRLNGMGGAPLGLWAGGPGHLAELAGRAVAIVGSRAATAYGERVSVDLAGQLAADGALRDGWTIVSGGAYGIDAAAHRGALAVDGRTVGIYANGLDVAYPPQNGGLFERLRGQRLVISETPPGQAPTRPGFLARNRLIAALGLGVIVVEAAVRSGAKNTAAWGDALHRLVMAVPGPIYAATSVGTHELIRDGRASLVASADDVRALLAPVGQAPLPAAEPAARLRDGLTPEQVRVCEALPARGAVGVAEVALRSGLSMAGCQAALIHLSCLDLAVAAGPGTWRAVRPRAVRVSPVGGLP